MQLLGLGGNAAGAATTGFEQLSRRCFVQRCGVVITAGSKSGLRTQLISHLDLQHEQSDFTDEESASQTASTAAATTREQKDNG